MLRPFTLSLFLVTAFVLPVPAEAQDPDPLVGPSIVIRQQGKPDIPAYNGNGTTYNNNGSVGVNLNGDDDDGYHQRSTMVGPDGKEYTVIRDVEHDDDGTTIRTTTEGPDGEKNTVKTRIDR